MCAELGKEGTCQVLSRKLLTKFSMLTNGS
jgi:hypothetical protein